MSATRHRIVTATSELFRHRGFHATSLKDITTAADAPTGSLYHFFPGGKTELARAVIVETGAAYQELFELIADAAPDVAAGVGAFFDGAAEVLEQSEFVDVCPIGMVAREVANTNETLRVATAHVFESWTGAAASRFQHAGIDPDVAHELAITVIAALEGAFVLARAHRDATILRQVGHQTAALVRARIPRKRLSRSV
jgi:AcrR family transcriptional regulator